MTITTFSGSTTPSTVDLDANFSDLDARTRGLRTDSANNLAINGTPSGWNSAGNLLLNNARFVAYRGAVGYIGQGLYYSGGYKYLGTDAVAYLSFSSGEFLFNSAPAGAADAALTTTVAAKLDIGGNWLIGTTSASASNSNSIINSPASSGANQAIQHASGVASGARYQAFRYGGSEIGSISQSGTTAVLYNTTSDQRLKDNIAPAGPAGALLDSVLVRQFDWRADGTHQRYGFIAQELAQVVPEAVHQPTDPDEMMAVDYSKLVPLLVAEVQSLRQRVATLEAGV